MNTYLHNNPRSLLQIGSVLILLAAALGLTTSSVSGQAGFDCGTVTEISQAECEALVALYESTDGANWLDNTDWLMSDTPCSWYGVDCWAGTISTIYSITLKNNQLTGALPDGIVDLYALQWLELDGNQLNGSIPAEIGYLSNLRGLNLNSNHLAGSIPFTFNGLSRLYWMDLSHNQLSGPVPSELGGVGSIGPFRLLDLSNNNLGGSLPPELGDLDDLEVLSLNNNQFDGEIPATLSGLANLESLQLNDNQFFSELPSALGDLINLTTLEIHNNPSLSGPLPINFVNLANLERFYFFGTGICEPMYGGLPAWLAGIGDLQGTGVDCPSQAVCGLVTQIPEAECLALVSLYESTGGDAWTLNYHWLTTIYPCDWHAVECAVSGHVTHLHMEYLNLSGHIPPQIGSLEGLVELNMAGNDLTGTIPSEVGNLENLSKLLLAYNELEGELPSELGNLHNLTVLNLGSNYLAGRLPSEMGSMNDLTQLWLSSNWLSGGIPNDFTNLTALHTFYFNVTQLCEPPDPLFQVWLNGIGTLISTEVVCNTATDDPVVSPVDSTTGDTPITLTFTEITGEGCTTLESTDTGPLPPAGFMLLDPETYFEISTTALYNGPIEICVDYSGLNVGDEYGFVIHHYEDGNWQPLTDVTMHDIANDVLCAMTDSLSPFAVYESIQTPQESIQAVIDMVDTLVEKGVLNRGQGRSLISKLELAIRQLNKGKERPALHKLEAFLHHVNAFTKAGILSSAEAQPMIEAVEAIIVQLE